MTDKKSFVTALFDGRLESAGLVPFPRLTSDPQETARLFSRIRADTQSAPGVERLRGLGLLSSNEVAPPASMSTVGAPSPVQR